MRARANTFAWGVVAGVVASVAGGLYLQLEANKQEWMQARELLRAQGAWLAAEFRREIRR